MTKDEHRQRHIELHQALEELVAEIGTEITLIQMIGASAAYSPERHQAIDELLADWIGHEMGYPSDKRLSNTTVGELVEWSAQQAKEPVNLPGSPDETTGDSDASPKPAGPGRDDAQSPPAAAGGRTRALGYGNRSRGARKSSLKP